MLIFLIAGIAGGATSALYLAYNYHPFLLNGAIHGEIFVSPLVAMYFIKKLNMRTALCICLPHCLYILQSILQ